MRKVCVFSAQKLSIEILHCHWLFWLTSVGENGLERIRPHCAKSLFQDMYELICFKLRIQELVKSVSQSAQSNKYWTVFTFITIFVSGTDYCSQGHDCHSNATCINLATRYSCQCKDGFHGDGKTCTGKLIVVLLGWLFCSLTIVFLVQLIQCQYNVIYTRTIHGIF